MAEKETCQKWQNPKMPTKRLIRILWKNLTKYLSKYSSEWQECSQGKIKSKQICKIGLKQIIKIVLWISSLYGFDCFSILLKDR